MLPGAVMVSSRPVSVYVYEDTCPFGPVIGAICPAASWVYASVFVPQLFFRADFRSVFRMALT